MQTALHVTSPEDKFERRLIVKGMASIGINLFATNVILPSLAYVYWQDDCSTHRETTINVLTLTGSIIGPLMFGFLADKYGRTRLYGIELVIVIVSTLVIAASGSGVGGHMSTFAWVASFRLLMGIGVGAEYPLSAVITSEWAPTRSRGRMLAAVFFMQPLGQFLAQLIGFLSLIGYNHMNDGVLIQKCFSNGTRLIDNNSCLIPNPLDPGLATRCEGIVDQIWRWVAGVGAIPALIAVIFRFSIGDPGLYDLDVQNEGERALTNTNKVYPRVRTPWRHRVWQWIRKSDPHEESGQPGIPMSNIDTAGGTAQPSRDIDEHPNHMTQTNKPIPDELSEVYQADESLPDQFTFPEIKRFFYDEGNWRYVLGTATCWFILDFAFYGIGIGNPQTLAQFWKSNRPFPTYLVFRMPSWYIDPTRRSGNNSLAIISYPNMSQPTVSIYEILHRNATQNMYTVSIGSLVGSAAMIFLVNYVPRRQFLTFSFVLISALFIITGIAFLYTWDSNNHAASIVLVAFCFGAFSLGVNTLTFIIPAEIFPTRYRCTCHGIAAAAGKLGSVISTAMLPQLHIANDWNSNHLGYMFIIFGLLMALGAPFSWAWLPDIQNKRNDNGWEAPSKTLEDLGRGVMGARADGEHIGFHDKLDPALAPLRIKMGIPPPRRRNVARRGEYS